MANFVETISHKKGFPRLVFLVSHLEEIKARLLNPIKIEQRRDLMSSSLISRIKDD